MFAQTRRRATMSCALMTMFFLGFAGAAQADFASESPAGSPRMVTAVALADAHWNVAPCGGAFSVEWVAQSPFVNAMSLWLSVGESYADPATNTECRIQLNPAAQWDWPKFCTIVVHEVGHLDGKPHVDDPNDVMTPVYTHPVAECDLTRDPQAAQAPVTAPFVPTPVAGTSAKKQKPAAPRAAAKLRAAKQSARARHAKLHRARSAKRQRRARRQL